MRMFGTAVLAAATLAFAAPRAEAQTVVGPYVAYHGNFDLGIGGFVSIPVRSLNENLFFKGDFGYYFPDDGGVSEVDFSYWEINADALLSFPLEGTVAPFAMAGLNIGRVSISEDVSGFDFAASGTEIGLNLGGGVALTGMGRFQPAVGAKIELNGGDDFVVFGALGFPLGGGGGR